MNTFNESAHAFIYLVNIFRAKLIYELSIDDKEIISNKKYEALIHDIDNGHREK